MEQPHQFKHLLDEDGNEYVQIDIATFKILEQFIENSGLSNAIKQCDTAKENFSSAEETISLIKKIIQA